MKKLVVLFTILFTLVVALSLGAQDTTDNTDKIPNYVQQAQQDDLAPSTANIAENAEEGNLTPVERTIVTRDAIISNAPAIGRNGQQAR